MFTNHPDTLNEYTWGHIYDSEIKERERKDSMRTCNTKANEECAKSLINRYHGNRP